MCLCMCVHVCPREVCETVFTTTNHLKPADYPKGGGRGRGGGGAKRINSASPVLDRLNTQST